MGRILLPMTRIWDEVYQIYKQVAEKNDVFISGIINSILLVVPAECPPCVSYALEEAYGLKPEKAKEIAYDLQEKIYRLMELVEGAQLAQEEEARS